jgi:hypothetical protein
MPKTKFATRSQSRNSPGTIKPFTDAELFAKKCGEIQLALAQSYRQCGDNVSALNCCLTGLRLTYGISRPLAVRDQLHEMACQIDPTSCPSA